MQLIGALVLCGALLAFPVDAADAARAAMVSWYEAYAPAMLPFFVVLPVLSGGDAAALYERVFGRVMRRLFNLPGRVAGAVVIGLVAGSPAGCLALVRLGGGTMNRGELSRAALMASGLSPLFLFSGIGGAMLGSLDAGLILVRAQLAAQLICGLLFRCAWADDDVETLAAPAAASSGAVAAVLGVCGYMVIFAVIARLVSVIVGGRIELPVLAALEVAGGSARISTLDMPLEVRLQILSAMCGFSGLSIMMQNLARLRLAGLPPLRLVIGKAVQAAVAVLACGVQLRLGACPDMGQTGAFDMAFCALIASVLLFIPTLCGIVVILRRSSHSTRKML